jgi:hypothetical protein
MRRRDRLQSHTCTYIHVHTYVARAPSSPLITPNVLAGERAPRQLYLPSSNTDLCRMAQHNFFCSGRNQSYKRFYTLNWTCTLYYKKVYRRFQNILTSTVFDGVFVQMYVCHVSRRIYSSGMVEITSANNVYKTRACC